MNFLGQGFQKLEPNSLDRTDKHTHPDRRNWMYNHAAFVVGNS